jgi:hypothetical protein
MKKTGHILIGVAITALALTARAAAKYSVSAEAVAAAMASTGVSVEPAQVALLSGVVASTPTPELRVRSIERSNSGRAMVRMECVNSSECLPFLVSVRLSSAPSEFALTPASPKVSSEPRVQPESKYVVRVGAPATLLLEGEHIHISLAVTCLTNGAAGQMVLAETPDHQKTFSAQVAGNGILRGRL